MKEELEVKRIENYNDEGVQKKIIFVKQFFYKDFAENPKIVQIKFKTRRN